MSELVLPQRPLPAAPTEIEALLGVLHRTRRRFAWKCFGLDQESMSRSLDPSTLTLAGLVKHMAFVEDHFFTHQLLGLAYPEVWAPMADDESWDFDSAIHDGPETLRVLWTAAVQRSEAATATALAAGGLDTRVADSGGYEPFSLRRIVVGLIEEYARHTGHADLIRESIDGRVGEDPS